MVERLRQLLGRITRPNPYHRPDGASEGGSDLRDPPGGPASVELNDIEGRPSSGLADFSRILLRKNPNPPNRPRQVREKARRVGRQEVSRPAGENGADISSAERHG
jgi:hypothetical protein